MKEEALGYERARCEGLGRGVPVDVGSRQDPPGAGIAPLEDVTDGVAAVDGG
jgi:hypothetical protein